MGKSKKGYVTVESATELLGCNRERDTTLYKKRESKQQRRGGRTMSMNFQQPTEPSETSVQRTGQHWMVGIIQRKSCNAVERLYGTTSECKRNQTENTRKGMKTHQGNVGPHNTH
jgi:hypothetical protein